MRMVIPALSFLLLLVVSSCQRELDDPVTTSNSTLLRMYVEVDTTLPSGSDTTYKISFSYDNQERVKHYSVIFDSFTEEGDYLYSGNDTLPYKWMAEWTEFGDTYRDTIYLTYINGVVSYDSAIQYNITTNDFFGTRVESYTAVGNSTFVQIKEYDLPLPSPVSNQWSGTIDKTYQNGNIIVQDDNSTAGVNPDRRHCIVSYDNKPNPFYKTEIPYPLLNKFKVQKNNVIEESSWDIPSSIESHYLYSYTYRADGYPLMVRLTDPSGTFGDKGFFYYTR